MIIGVNFSFQNVEITGGLLVALVWSLMQNSTSNRLAWKVKIREPRNGRKFFLKRYLLRIVFGPN